MDSSRGRNGRGKRVSSLLECMAAHGRGRRSGEDRVSLLIASFSVARYARRLVILAGASKKEKGVRVTKNQVG